MTKKYQKKYHLVYCKSRAVLFMMANNDCRLGTDSYDALGVGDYDHATKTLSMKDKRRYQVFADWSVKLKK